MNLEIEDETELNEFCNKYKNINNTSLNTTPSDSRENKTPSSDNSLEEFQLNETILNNKKPIKKTIYF